MTALLRAKRLWIHLQARPNDCKPYPSRRCSWVEGEAEPDQLCVAALQLVDQRPGELLGLHPGELLGRFTVPGPPVGKPRMTRRDKWARRPTVVEYRAWADRARNASADLLRELLGKGVVPGRVYAVARMPLPASLSGRRRDKLMGSPHRVKPDADNIAKALLDALLDNDQVVYDQRVLKLWDDGHGPRLDVEIYE